MSRKFSDAVGAVLRLQMSCIIRTEDGARRLHFHTVSIEIHINACLWLNPRYRSRFWRRRAALLPVMTSCHNCEKRDASVIPIYSSITSFLLRIGALRMYVTGHVFLRTHAVTLLIVALQTAPHSIVTASLRGLMAYLKFLTPYISWRMGSSRLHFPP